MRRVGDGGGLVTGTLARSIPVPVSMIIVFR